MQRGRGEKHVLLLYLEKNKNICCLPAAAMRSIELHNEIFLIRSPFLKIADSVVQKTMLSENLRNYGRGKKHICYLPGKKLRTFSTYLSTYLPAAMRSVEFDNEIFFSRAEASMADVRT
jgi:hypothetical protein